MIVLVKQEELDTSVLVCLFIPWSDPMKWYVMLLRVLIHLNSFGLINQFIFNFSASVWPAYKISVLDPNLTRLNLVLLCFSLAC